jgi:Tfp pilus assembly PilM family ATPase
VIAAEREKINRLLAIYENVNLQIMSMGVWPAALINCYVKFFGRRKTDVQSVVLLLDIGTNYTNVVICRHRNLLFARSIPIGTSQLGTAQAGETTGLVTELTAYRRQLGLMYKNAQIERLIFISGQSVSKNIYTDIAEQLELSAHIGECLAAVEITLPGGIERRENQTNWATAFGLSLSEE